MSDLDRAGIWADQSSRMKGDRFVCGDCGWEWFTTAIGAPFAQDRCRCGGRLTAIWDVFPVTSSTSATIYVHDENGWREVPATIRAELADWIEQSGGRR